MIRLLRAELGRSRSRLLVWLVVIASLAIAGFVVADAYTSTRPPSDAMVAEQTVYFEQSLADWEANHEQWYADCVAGQAQERAASGDDTVDWDCEAQTTAPTLEDWIYRPTFAESAPQLLSGYLQLLLAGALLLGASLVAAESATGNLGLWLTFEPRRTRVLVSKILAAAVTALCYALVCTAVALGGVAAATSVNGALDATAELWRSLALTSVRGILLVVVVAAVGGALGALLRHTAAVLGAAFGYLIVVEMLVRSTLPTVQPWLVVTNLTAVLEGTTEVYWQDCSTSAADGTLSCVDVTRTITLADGSLYLGVLAAVVLLGSWLVFRRRDVS